jgi:hypothetical protein
MAVFSADLKPLMREGKAAGERSRELQAAAARTGGRKRFCPPAGKFSMGSDEFMQRLSAIPAPERSQIDMTEAVTRMFAAKFPC